MSCQGQFKLQLPLPSDSHRLHELHDSKAMLKVNVKTRSSKLPKCLTTATICSESETSPDTASHKIHLCAPQFDDQDTPGAATEWDNTSHYLIPDCRCPLPNHPSKAHQCMQEKVEKGMGEEWKLKHSHSLQAHLLVFSWAPRRTYYPFPQPLLPPELEPTNPALSSHWSFPSHPTLPLLINPPFSSPSLASIV